MKTYQTYILYFTNGKTEYLFARKDEFLDYLPAKKWLLLDHAEILNRADDHVKHKPISKAQILR